MGRCYCDGADDDGDCCWKVWYLEVYDPFSISFDDFETLGKYRVSTENRYLGSTVMTRLDPTEDYFIV